MTQNKKSNSSCTTPNAKVGWWTGGVENRRVAYPKAPTDIFSTMFGRTELIIGASRANDCEELGFEVHSPHRPPKLAQKGETSVSRPKNVVEKNMFRRKLN